MNYTSHPLPGQEFFEDPFETDELEIERARLKARLAEFRPVMTEARRIQRRLNAIERMQRGETTIHPPRTAGYLSTAERKRQILALLNGRPELRRKDVAEALGLTRARAGQLVNLMVADGLVDDRGPGELMITEAGRSLVPPEIKTEVGGWQRVPTP